LAELTDVAVLVIDDNATNSRILECLLASWGMLPALAANGPEGLRMMEEAYQSGTAFPLVLLDFQMPRMDGFAVAERIKQTEHLAAATIMMLTSGGKRGDAARCRELGVAAYLTKPIRQAELLDAICLALGTKSGEKNEPAPLITRHSVRERRRPLQVLVAEDNLVNQMLVVTLLMKAGHEVALVGNGVEAVATWKNQPFDVIMMDMQMPEMDGFEAVAHIRRQEKQSGGHVPIIAMTAHALVGDRERCLAAGMDGYISKPLDGQKLFDSIDAAVGRSGSDLKARAPTPAVPPALLDPASVTAIDEVLLDKLIGGDTALLRDLVRIYRETSPELLEQIDRALTGKDAKRLRNAAHALKGAVSNFAAVPTMQACAALESIGASGNLAEAAAAREELGKHLGSFHAKLATIAAADAAGA
jgi:CheY-like chemotaxis protein